MKKTVKELLERTEREKKKPSKNFFRPATHNEKQRLQEEEEKALELRNKFKRRK